MEAYSESSPMSLLGLRWVRVLMYVVMAAMLLASIMLVTLTINGYGTLRLEGLPAAATVSLNGHTTKATSLKLRPGSYELVVTSPSTAPFSSNVNIALWRQVTYKPTLQIRSADAIAQSLLGAIPGTTIAPKMAEIRWLQFNTWFVGRLAPTDTVLVAHYDVQQESWVIALCNAPGYPDDPSTLPAGIASYVQPLLAGVE